MLLLNVACTLRLPLCLQVRYYEPGGAGAGEGLQPGDVLLSNHPQLAGGSHLPDITVITPVWQDGKVRHPFSFYL